MDTLTPVVEAKAVRFGYVSREKRTVLSVLEDVDLTVNEGEFVSIVGPSGCGKSTLLKLIAGLLEPSQGTIRLWRELPKVSGAKRRIGFTFQSPVLLPWRNALENVRLPLELETNGPGDLRGASSALQTVGLAGFEDFYPHELSGGMQTRVSIARALVTDPELLILDEPFAHLDEISRLQLQRDLSGIWLAHRTTTLLVTHSLLEAIFLSDRVVVMTPRPGRILRSFRVSLSRPRSSDLLAQAPARELHSRLASELDQMSYR